MSKGYTSMRARVAVLERDLEHYKSIAERREQDASIDYLLESAETLMKAAAMLMNLKLENARSAPSADGMEKDV